MLRWGLRTARRDRRLWDRAGRGGREDGMRTPSGVAADGAEELERASLCVLVLVVHRSQTTLKVSATPARPWGEQGRGCDDAR